MGEIVVIQARGGEDGVMLTRAAEGVGIVNVGTVSDVGEAGDCACGKEEGAGVRTASGDDALDIEKGSTDASVADVSLMLCSRRSSEFARNERN